MSDSDGRNRIDRVVTRLGDGGDTSLASGPRVRKSSARIAALGDIDECNCQLGMLLASLDAGDTLREALAWLQHRLFDVGGALAYPEATRDFQPEVARAEAHVAALNAALPPLAEFVLPGGSEAAARAHVARAVCRRAERALVRVADAGEQLPASALAFMNRVSDLLFVVARTLARRAGGELAWRRDA
jgi:cob(I)alamin adenosyltransferase